MTVPLEKALIALTLLREGSSVRSVERITELHRDTIPKVLVTAGEKAERIMATKTINVQNHWAAVCLWSPITISAGFTSRCALRLRWKRVSPIIYGQSKNYFQRTCWSSRGLEHGRSSLIFS